MAIRPHTGFTSAYPVLEGVTFVLNEKCQPPPKVTLPIKFEAGNAAEVVFLEYDTSLEREVLKRCAAEREILMAEHARREQEWAAAEASNKDLPTLDALAGEAESPVENSAHEQQEPSIPDTSLVLPQKSDVLIPSAVTGPGGILIPMPATSASGGVSSTGTSRGLIDLKDFENEQDPFENLSLRVMNDREELKNVFRATTAVQRTNEGLPVEQTTAPRAKVDSVKTAINAADAPAMHSAALLQYVNGVTPGSSSAISYVPCQQIPNSAYGYPMSTAIGNPSSQNLFPGASPLNLAQNSGLSSAAFSADRSRMAAAVAADTRQSSVVSNTLLRSAKSTPDIPSLSEANAVASGNRRTPPPPSSVKPHAVFYDNSKSTATVCQPPPSAVRPTPVHLPSLPSNGIAGGVTSTSSRSAAYLSLPAESQHFVDVIRDMGFDEVDVVRAVQELGVDDKLVLDHLCQLGQLRDKGLSTSDAAAALFLFDNSVEKAETYLKLVKNFSELGFQGDRVREVLITNNLDEDKCLDLLIGT